MYSPKTLFTQKPATISGLIGAAIALYQSLAGDSSVIGDGAALKIVGFLGLLLAVLWVDPSTVNANQAEDDKDDAFLQGLALPNTDKAAAAVKAVAKKATPRKRAEDAGAVTLLEAFGIALIVIIVLVVLF